MIHQEATKTRQTLAYSKDHDGQYLDNFPLVYGMKCTGWSSKDLFEEHEEVMKVLANIAIGDLGYGDAEKLANEFFELKKESPHSYYDEKDNEE